MAGLSLEALDPRVLIWVSGGIFLLYVLLQGKSLQLPTADPVQVNSYVDLLARVAPNVAAGVRGVIAEKVGSIAARYSVDPVYVLAVAYFESGLNPLSVGSSGERGLMQVTTAALSAAVNFVGDRSKFDYQPAYLTQIGYGLEAGTIYLKICLARAKSDMALAYAYYNGGWNPPSISKSRGEKVVEIYNRFSKLLAG